MKFKPIKLKGASIEALFRSELTKHVVTALNGIDEFKTLRISMTTLLRDAFSLVYLAVQSSKFKKDIDVQGLFISIVKSVLGDLSDDEMSVLTILTSHFTDDMKSKKTIIHKLFSSLMKLLGTLL